MESKTLKIIELFHDEAEAQALLFSHHKQVGGLCFFLFFYSIFSDIAPSALSLSQSSAPPYLLQGECVPPVSPSWESFHNPG